MTPESLFHKYHPHLHNLKHVFYNHWLLDKIFGCQIHWAGENRKGEDIPKIVEQLKQEGKMPYVVPYGGSNELGALAFVKALEELEHQRQESQVSFTHIIFASSSGGTQAGLMLGKKMVSPTTQN